MKTTTMTWLALTALAVSLTACDTLVPLPCAAGGAGVAIPALDALPIGGRVPLQVQPNLCNNPGAAVEWEVSDPEVARVAVTGRHTAELLAVAPGEGTLIVRETGQPDDEGYLIAYRVPAPSLPSLEPDTTALFQTDSVHYELQAGEAGWAGEISVAFANARSDTVAFANCGTVTPVALQRNTSAGWTTVWRLRIPPCVSPPVTVAPGATHTFAVGVHLGYPWTAGSPLQSEDLPGVYRLTWTAVQSGTAETPADPIPEWQRVSNPFTLTARATSR